MYKTQGRSHESTRLRTALSVNGSWRMIQWLGGIVSSVSRNKGNADPQHHQKITNGPCCKEAFLKLYENPASVVIGVFDDCASPFMQFCH